MSFPSGFGVLYIFLVMYLKATCCLPHSLSAALGNYDLVEKRLAD